MSKAFIARMKEDIEQRRIKEEKLELAEKRYFREKYGSLSRERVSMIFKNSTNSENRQKN